VYKYLRDLGYKFYLPDSLYTFIPSLKSVFKKTSVMETPFPKIRDFFGTGGFGSGKTDPDQSVQKAWQLGNGETVSELNLSWPVMPVKHLILTMPKSLKNTRNGQHSYYEKWPGGCFNQVELL
jgi:hypothetical protein